MHYRTFRLARAFFCLLLGCLVAGGCFCKDAAGEALHEQLQQTQPKPNQLLFDFCNDPALTAQYQKALEALPISMYYRFGQSVEAEISDPELIRTALEALATVRIGQRVDYSILDGDLLLYFTMQDQSKWGVCFETQALFCWQNNNYAVLDAGGLQELQQILARYIRNH